MTINISPQRQDILIPDARMGRGAARIASDPGLTHEGPEHSRPGCAGLPSGRLYSLYAAGRPLPGFMRKPWSPGGGKAPAVKKGYPLAPRKSRPAGKIPARCTPEIKSASAYRIG